MDSDLKEHHQRADVGIQRIARVYAESLLDAAARAGETAEILAQIDSLVKDVFKADPRLETLFSSAAMGRNQRRESLEKALKGRAHPLLYNFLQVLNDHERLDLLRPILGAAHALDDERNRRLRVMVSAAVPLPDDFRERIANRVRGEFRLEPIISEHVDPALLGGLKVQIGDIVYDSTIRTRLDNLKHQFQTRSSHEIQSRRDRIGSDAGN